MNMNMSGKTSAFALAAVLVCGGPLISGSLLRAQDADQSHHSSDSERAKQDMHRAGHETKNAARDAARGTKRGTKSAYYKSKDHTRRAVNKTKNTTKGAVRGAKAGAREPDESSPR